MKRARAPIVLLALITLGTLALVVHHRKTSLHNATLLADPDSLLQNATLRAYALAAGRQVYRNHCSNCHGDTGRGSTQYGIPDLTDNDFLYGNGRVSEIEAVVRHGIRAGDPRGFNLASMPAYGTPTPYANEPIEPLSPQGIDDVARYVLSLQSTGPSPADAAVQRGREIYAGRGGCYDCHTPTADGDSAIGAPNLTDRITLYGDGSLASLKGSIEMGRAGYSPAFYRVLTPLQTRTVAVYVASLHTDPHPPEERHDSR